MRKKKGYGQFCPVAKASEILAERWTPIVVRELLHGSRHFAELRRGIPLMTPVMLATRLRELESAGIVTKRPSRGRRSTEYRLTPAGQDLRGIVRELGVWGQRWAERRIRRDDLDPGFLMWAMRRRIDVAWFDGMRSVALFRFPDARPEQRRWWLVVERGEVDLCLRDPGFDVDVEIVASVRAMAEIYLGRVDPRAAQRSGAITVRGRRDLVRTFARWCGQSGFADVAPANARRVTSRP